MASESPPPQRQRRSRWGPRRSLAVAIVASVVIAVAAGISAVSDDSTTLRAERIALGIALAIASLAVARWLPAIVPLRGPGRILVAVLAADAVLIGLAFIAFAGWLTPAAYTAAAIGAVTAGVAVFWWFPRWQAQHWPRTIEGRERIELEDKARATVAQLLSGLGLIATVAITLYSVNEARVTANDTLQLTERQQSADRFSRAINQLGARSGSKRATEIRLGGIYSLGQYALQTPFPSRDDEIEARSTVATILTAYVRTNGRLTPRALRNPPPPVPADCTTGASDREGHRYLEPDIDAALDVLTRLYPSYRNPGDTPAGLLPELDLAETDLRGADLGEMDLSFANLEGSAIAGADLGGSTLRGVDLIDAHAQNACFFIAHLENATTRGADLRHAIICGDRGPGDLPSRWRQRGAACPPG
jgi:hypothetical protein